MGEEQDNADPRAAMGSLGGGLWSPLPSPIHAMPLGLQPQPTPPPFPSPCSAAGPGPAPPWSTPRQANLPLTPSLAAQVTFPKAAQATAQKPTAAPSALPHSASLRLSFPICESGLMVSTAGGHELQGEVHAQQWGAARLYPQTGDGPGAARPGAGGHRAGALEAGRGGPWRRPRRRRPPSKSILPSPSVSAAWIMASASSSVSGAAGPMLGTVDRMYLAGWAWVRAGAVALWLVGVQGARSPLCGWGDRPSWRRVPSGLGLVLSLWPGPPGPAPRKGPLEWGTGSAGVGTVTWTRHGAQGSAPPSPAAAVT